MRCSGRLSPRGEGGRSVALPQTPPSVADIISYHTYIINSRRRLTSSCRTVMGTACASSPSSSVRLRTSSRMDTYCSRRENKNSIKSNRVDSRPERAGAKKALNSVTASSVTANTSRDRQGVEPLHPDKKKHTHIFLACLHTAYFAVVTSVSTNAQQQHKGYQRDTIAQNTTSETI